MNYREITKENYKLHIIKTDRFKTIKFRIFMRGSINKEEITLRNFLMDMLNYSTNTYKSRKELVRISQDLYGVNICSRGYRLGDSQIINFYLSLLNEKYTESGMLEESIKLLADVLLNPNVTDNKFDQESFDIIYRNTKEVIESIKDSTGKYSMIRMLEHMGDDIYSYNEYGTIDDLNKITRESLYQYYIKFMNTAKVDIYVIGNVDEDEIDSLVSKYFRFKNTYNQDKILPYIHKEKRDVPQIVKEKEDINQSKLSIGCKLYDLTDRERNYVLTIYNMILGSSTDARFFKNIREKHSICYSIFSSLDKLDDLLFIKAGISKENFDLCIELINKEMEDIKSGNISDQELENAKNSYVALLNEIYDNDEAIIDTYVSTDLLGVGDIEKRKEEIKTVTKEEIINLSKKINIDTIYLLEEGGEKLDN